MELAICEPDPELTALISGGLLLRKNFGTVQSPENKSIGWAAPSVGDDPTGNGIALEVWSFAVKDGRRVSELPYFHWVFPYARLRQSGDRVIENGMLATTFEGYGLGNILFGAGLDGRWEYPLASERSYSYARSDWAPQGLKGFYTWFPSLAADVNNKSLTSNIATLTTAAAHGFSAGQTVTVAGVDSTFNGTHVITQVSTPTTFRFAKTAANVESTAVTPVGTAVREAGYLAVSDFESQGSTTGFNVPGSEEYNADLPVDFIIASTEDPS
jgi:hypothetical protein